GCIREQPEQWYRPNAPAAQSLRIESRGVARPHPLRSPPLSSGPWGRGQKACVLACVRRSTGRRPRGVVRWQVVRWEDGRCSAKAMAGAVRCDDSPARVVFARPRSFYWEGAGRPVVYKTRRHGTELTPHVAVSRRCAFRIAVGAPPYSPEEVPHEPLFPAAP